MEATLIRTAGEEDGSAARAAARTQRGMERIVAYGNRLLDRVQPHWPARVPVRRPRPTTVVYASYPYYFVDAFPAARDRDVRRLAVAMRLVADSVCVTDVLCDYASGPRITYDTMTVQALQFEAYRLLYGMLPPDVPFWTRFQRYMAEWMGACIREVEHVRPDLRWGDADEATIVGIARGKAAMAKAVVAGLGAIAADDAPVEPLVRSVERCHLGVQLLDDLQDWKDDLSRGVPTHVGLALVRARPDLPGQPLTEEVLAAFARELYYNGLASRALEHALVELDAAARLTEGLHVPAWRERIGRCRKRCESLAKDLEQITRANRVRTAEAPPEPAVPLPATAGPEKDAREALRFLLREHRAGFGEARHRLAYPWEFDPYGEREAQACDVYPRALVVDALRDARPWAPALLDPVIAGEVEYLLAARSADGPGCWSYFPGVAELPGSADVTAQAVIALHGGGPPAEGVRAQAAEALDAVLKGCGLPDGSFVDWILAADAPAPRDTARVLGLKDEWMRGRDVEVAANVAYALALHDPVRFADRVARTARWVGERQERPGGWWGFGLYSRRSYGTYACARLLSRTEPGSPLLERMLDQVRGTQRPDGGWAEDGLPAEAAFDTALSLLTLALAADGAPPADADRARMERGLDFLHPLRNADGSWPRAAFMKVGREEYGSRTVTTAFVLKALMRCLHVL